MKTFPNILLCLFCLAGWALAAAPVKVPNTRYARLWTNSPFTVKPVVTGPERVEINPFEDWALGSVAKVNNDYFLVLLNKKKQGEKVIVEPGQPSEYKVVDVRQDPKDPKKTEVTVQKGSQKGTVTYDEKVFAAVPKAPQGQPQGRPPVPGQPPQPGQPVPATANPPRMRVVPPQGGQPSQPSQPPQSGQSGQSGHSTHGGPRR